MGFGSFLKNTVSSAGKVFSAVTNPTTILDVAGVDSNKLTGGLSGKLQNANAGTIASDLVSGNSIRDNIQDGLTVLSAVQNPKQLAGGIATNIINSANGKQQARQNIATNGQQSYGTPYVYSTPNISNNSGSEISMNHMLIYGGIGLISYLLIKKYRR